MQSRDPLVLVPGGPAMPWPPEDARLTESARRALRYAQEEAAELGNDHLGPAHILVGLAREEQGVAAGVLAELGGDAARARNALAEVMGRSRAFPATELTLIPRAQRALELARFESLRMAHDTTDTEHLLIALVDEGDALPRRILERMGIDAADMRQRVLARLRVPAAYGSAEHATPHDGPYARFDESARRVLALAADEAAAIGTTSARGEHIAIGLARVAEQSPEAARIRRTFSELGIASTDLRNVVQRMPWGRVAPRDAREITFTRSAKLIVELALNEAGAGTVAPEHLLRAIVCAEDGIALHVLAQCGATRDRIRVALTPE